MSTGSDLAARSSSSAPKSSLVTAENLQLQLQAETKVKMEIMEKAQKLLQSKRALKDQYNQVVEERNALQLKLAGAEKMDIVKQMQEKIAKLEKERESSETAEELKRKLQHLAAENASLEAKLKETTLNSDQRGLLAGKPSPAEKHYVISQDNAEKLTKRIKKLQTELWNLEIKHQQLQEVHASCAAAGSARSREPTISVTPSGNDEAVRLKEAIGKEKDTNASLQQQYKELSAAVVSLREDLKNAMENDPNDKLLYTLYTVAKKATDSFQGSLGDSDRISKSEKRRASTTRDHSRPSTPDKKDKDSSSLHRSSKKDKEKIKDSGERKSKVKMH